jgi:hypothetical protein
VHVHRLIDSAHPPVRNDTADLIPVEEYLPHSAGAIVSGDRNLGRSIEPLPVDRAESSVVWIKTTADPARFHGLSRG